MKLLFATVFALGLWIDNGMTSSCDKVTSCKCKMSDGSGDVDLTSLQGMGGQPRFKDVAGTENLKYSWNPCSPFNEGGEYGCTNVAVCQIYSFIQVSGGSQASSRFSVNGNGTLSVTYTESYTNSTVDLICDKSARDPVFTATGDPQSTNNIRLRLKHVCNCPGMCDGSGPIPYPPTPAPTPTAPAPTPDPCAGLRYINIILVGVVWVLLLLLIVAVVIIVTRRNRDQSSSVIPINQESLLHDYNRYGAGFKR